MPTSSGLVARKNSLSARSTGIPQGPQPASSILNPRTAEAVAAAASQDEATMTKTDTLSLSLSLRAQSPAPPNPTPYFVWTVPGSRQFTVAALPLSLSSSASL